MPHIFIRMFEGYTPEQKKKLVEDASAAVSRNLEMPAGMRMEIMEHELVEISVENLARGGKLHADSPPSAYVIVNYIVGRTPEQKRGIAKDITEAVARNLKLAPEAVTVELVEFSPENISHGGKLTVDNPPPGLRLPGGSPRGTEKRK